MKFVGVLVLAGTLLLPGHVRAAGSDGDSGSGANAARMQSARDLLKQEKYAKAASILENMLAFSPGDADALNLLGYSLRKQKKYEKAEGFYLKALNVDARHVGAMEYLGELYLNTGRPELANKMLDRLRAICSSGCKELKELRSAISAYRTN